MKKIIQYWLPTIIFNIRETIIIIGIGLIMRIPIVHILNSMILFAIARKVIGGEKHYKDPKLCSIWSAIIFSLIFSSYYVMEFLYIPLTLIAAYTTSKKADCKAFFMWNGKQSKKYKFLEEYVINNQGTSAIKEFEEVLYNVNEENYKIYMLKYYNGLSFEEIVNQTKLSNTARLTERLDAIQTTLKAYLVMKKND